MDSSQLGIIRSRVFISSTIDDLQEARVCVDEEMCLFERSCSRRCSRPYR